MGLKSITKPPRTTHFIIKHEDWRGVGGQFSRLNTYDSRHGGENQMLTLT